MLTESSKEGPSIHHLASKADVDPEKASYFYLLLEACIATCIWYRKGDL